MENNNNIVDLFIDNQVIKNGISSDIYKRFKYIKDKDNYFQPKTNFGFIGKNQALNDLMLDCLAIHTFDILKNFLLMVKK